MIVKNAERPVYTFSQTRGYIFMVDHLGKFLVTTIIIIIIAMYKGNLDRTVTICAIVFLCTSYYLVANFLKKTACKIIIDFGSSQIKLYMNRTGDIVTSDFQDIKEILINFYITFFLAQREVHYNDLQNRELLTCLNRIRRIQWGPLSALLVPNRHLRNSFKGENRGRRK
jgi:hypothetical protein